MTADELQAARERQCALSAFENAYAVKTQVARLRSIAADDPWENIRRTADAQFLVIALWRLRMAAVVCEDLRPHLLADAVAVFDTSLPGLRDLRNVLMHYDSYVLGAEGRRTRVAEGQRWVSLNDVRSMFSSRDGFGWLGHEYRYDDVEQTSTARYVAITGVVGQPV